MENYSYIGKISVTVIILASVVSCGLQTETDIVNPSATQTPKPIVTDTFNPPTATSSSIHIPNPTLTPTVVCPVYSAPISLYEVILSAEDIDEETLPLITSYFLPPLIEIDTSNSYCVGDCVSRQWIGDRYINVITLTIFRTDDISLASKTIEDHNSKIQDGILIKEWERERSWVRAPQENTRIVEYCPPSGVSTVWLTTHYCNFAIIIKLERHLPSDWISYNAYDDVSILGSLANFQITKLKESGLLP